MELPTAAFFHRVWDVALACLQLHPPQDVERASCKVRMKGFQATEGIFGPPPAGAGPVGCSAGKNGLCFTRITCFDIF
jgi:hypothetical protein